jgi:hypothetical protein
MRSPSPAAEFAEPIFVQRRNPFRDGTLGLRVPSAMLPPGDEWHCEAFVHETTILAFLE